MNSIAAADCLPAMGLASAGNKSLVVSIHDVAPSNREVVEKMISELTRSGVRVTSLLVVPDYHHEGLFTQDRQFVSWLRELEAQGHEIVIHGYFHERPRRQGETLRDKLITQFYTQREGEFYDLDYAEALRRITSAREKFREAGLNPRGFIAPAWLLGEESGRAVCDADLEYTTRLATVCDVRTGRSFASRSLVYSVRNGWRRATSLVWNGLLARCLATSPLLRLGIHPPDYLYPRIWRQINDALNMTRGERVPTTYRDWIAEQRFESAGEV